MACKHSTRKNTSSPTQPQSCEVKDLVSHKPLNFPPFYFSRRYSHHIPLQSPLDPTYTSSPKSFDLHQDSSLNEELQGLTPKDHLYHMPKIEVDYLHHHTQAYLKYIGQIPIIYQIPRSHGSHKRAQPFGEDDTLTSSINDLIIDTISDIRQLVATIAHSQTEEDPEFHNLLDFPEKYSTLYDFLEAQ